MMTSGSVGYGRDGRKRHQRTQGHLKHAQATCRQGARLGMSRNTAQTRERSAARFKRRTKNIQLHHFY